MLIGLCALLGPCELIALSVSDSLLTSETGVMNVVFLKLHLVRARTRGARQQSHDATSKVMALLFIPVSSPFSADPPNKV